MYSKLSGGVLVTSHAQERAMRRYRARTTSVLVRVNPKTEPKIYQKLKNQDNKAGYIKSLISEDVGRNGLG